ncbi:excalibur calcium-binding domain-containing protein [Pseudophaeobacter arcticus]
MNCSDFPSAAAAQKFFLTSGGPRKDRHGLDGDGDGLACEWGGYLKRVASKGAKRFRSTRSRSRCYVGPRGGTYTVTASGRKNYGGC